MKPGMGDARRTAKQTKTLDDVSRTGYEFMMSDLDVALTLARIASRAAEDDNKRIRNLQNARRAYDKVQELLQRIGLSAGQQQQIVEKLNIVKSTLKKLGESF
jgi:multidrug efflux pump subunit AcrA (membrane-fusion protein)